MIGVDFGGTGSANKFQATGITSRGTVLALNEELKRLISLIKNEPVVIAELEDDTVGRMEWISVNDKPIPDNNEKYIVCAWYNDKNIDKICMLEEESGYIEAVDGDDYGHGSSYANRGKHYVRGNYSRDGGRDGMGEYSSRRDNRGRYSRDDGRSEMMRHIEAALDSANEQDREAIKRLMRQMENS